MAPSDSKPLAVACLERAVAHCRRHRSKDKNSWPSRRLGSSISGPCISRPSKPLTIDAIAWDLPALLDEDVCKTTTGRAHRQFAQSIHIMPWGVLGTRRLSCPTSATADSDGHQVSQTAAAPNALTAVVDSFGMQHIHGHPLGTPQETARRSSSVGEVYRWLAGNDSKSLFTEDVKSGLKAVLDATYHAYGLKKVIHVASPNLQTYTDRVAVVRDLATAYRNCLHEFTCSGLPCLRLLPLSGGSFSGPYAQQLPDITREALIDGFKGLDPREQKYILESTSVELCLFEEEDYENFLMAFDPDLFNEEGDGQLSDEETRSGSSTLPSLSTTGYNPSRSGRSGSVSQSRS